MTLRRATRFWGVKGGGTSGPDPDAFIMTFALGASDSITLPTISTGTYNYDVDWGDGTTDIGINTWNSAARIHTYTGLPAGDYVVSITGTFNRFSFFDVNTSILKLVKINQWGNTGLTTMFRCFRGATNLISIDEAGPLPSTILNMQDVFNGCRFPSVNADIFSLLSGCNTFQQCFQGITTLLSLPSGLLDNCVAALNFQFFCAGCTALVSIPEDLYDPCTLMTNFDYVHENNTALTVNISNLVLGMDMSHVNTVRQVFNNCPNIVGDGQDLIDKPKSATFPASTFNWFRSLRLCSSLADFATIPSDWK